MIDKAHTASDMIAGMTPVLLDEVFVFATVTEPVEPNLLDSAKATYREAEGMSLIFPVATAQAHGIPIDSEMRCITLNVYSSLEGVGLTAAVAQALADHGIACNMVAAYHHAHAIVPWEMRARAMEILQRLAGSGAP